ncbi:isochorismate-pyruvate lyase [Pseudomonas azotoformans]|uniref:chorismate mutase n=1 Tax=Pseudomonas azotoformans TaxID=47878 RepID=A0A1V2JHS8_PSEAZ|nr:isochorismate lyase [Pseudomonas azotoformans]OIN46456.1 isochorismate-pyruvate lyase [Pseudomonas azotoformans]ONH44912.1 isochorismate-pyruvate lyase [Pseudomonas azotoformans]SDN09916.1 isochorismate pyruvate lyase [Pseudomonas azotoformans]
MKTPQDCTGLTDIRHAIDTLDHQIIDALGLRMQYVKAASQFKPDQASIAAPDRVAAMLPQRREWAQAVGLDGEFVESLFNQIIHWYIAEQTAFWLQKKSTAV